MNFGGKQIAFHSTTLLLVGDLKVLNEFKGRTLKGIDQLFMLIF